MSLLLNLRGFQKGNDMPTSTIVQIQRQIAKLQAKAKAIETASNSKKIKAVQKVRQLMDKLGVTVEDLGGTASAVRATAANGKGRAAKKPAAKKPGRKSGALRPVPIRYRDPETGNTWTGRGKPPVWLAERMKSGKTKEDYLIAAAAATIAPAAAPEQSPAT
jgi:DNA-binding protein H-NS